VKTVVSNSTFDRGSLSPTDIKLFDVFANGARLEIGSSGWTRTSNPPVNSQMQVIGLAGSRAGSSDGILLIPVATENSIRRGSDGLAFRMDLRPLAELARGRRAQPIFIAR